MKALNTVKITFPSRSVNEGFARSALSAFAAQADPTLDELADVKTAVSEAVTNCIVHAYANTIGPITLTAALYEDGTLRVAVADKGCGIPDVSKAMEPLFTTGGAERAGLGFAVMESFMDSVKVRSAPGKGTRIFHRDDGNALQCCARKERLMARHHHIREAHQDGYYLIFQHIIGEILKHLAILILVYVQSHARKLAGPQRVNQGTGVNQCLGADVG